LTVRKLQIETQIHRHAAAQERNAEAFDKLMDLGKPVAICLAKAAGGRDPLIALAREAPPNATGYHLLAYLVPRLAPTAPWLVTQLLALLAPPPPSAATTAALSQAGAPAAALSQAGAPAAAVSQAGAPAAAVSQAGAPAAAVSQAGAPATRLLLPDPTWRPQTALMRSPPLRSSPSQIHAPKRTCLPSAAIGGLM
jgi:hypothetical protein